MADVKAKRKSRGGHKAYVSQVLTETKDHTGSEVSAELYDV